MTNRILDLFHFFTSVKSLNLFIIYIREHLKNDQYYKIIMSILFVMGAYVTFFGILTPNLSLSFLVGLSFQYIIVLMIKKPENFPEYIHKYIKYIDDYTKDNRIYSFLIITIGTYLIVALFILLVKNIKILITGLILFIFVNDRVYIRLFEMMEFELNDEKAYYILLLMVGIISYILLSFIFNFFLILIFTVNGNLITILCADVIFGEKFDFFTDINNLYDLNNAVVTEEGKIVSLLTFLVGVALQSIISINLK